MKKYFLIVILLLLTGCYDYVEINDLGFISAVGIDYQDGFYNGVFELIKTEEIQDSQSIMINATGQTINDLFENLTLKITKSPYYHHLKTVVISKEVAQNHLKELADYLIRSPKIRNEFYLVILEDSNLPDVFQEEVGQKIVSLIKTSNKQINVVFNKSFEDILEKLLNDKIEATATVIGFQDDHFILKGIGLFKNYQYITYLDTSKSSLLNILNNEDAKYPIKLEYDKKLIELELYNTKVKYLFNHNQTTIHINAEAKILENTTNLDLRDHQIYEQLENDAINILNKDMNDLLNYLKKENIDVIGLNDKQFKKSRKNNPQYLINTNIKIDITIKINWKGTIFQIDNE